MARPGIVRAFVGLLALLAAEASVARAQTGDAPRILPAPADDTPLRFQHLGIDDGMSQSSAFSILQDRHGFMWFGTQGGGLNVYDGYGFKIYRPIPGDSTSLPGDFPGAIFEDASGRIWVGTESGLALFDAATETFRRFPLELDAPDSTGAPTSDPGVSQSPTQPPPRSTEILEIDEDPDGNLWILSSIGLIRANTQTGAFALEVPWSTFSPIDISAGAGIGDMEITPDGRVWVAAATGLFGYDPASGEHTEYISRLAEGRFDEHFFSSITHDSGEPGVLWISGYGLYRFDTRDGSYRQFLTDSPRQLDNGFVALAANPAEPGAIWLAGFEAGLARFDLGTESFTRFPSDPSNPDSPSSMNLGDVYFDRTGLLWIGTRLSGVDRVDLNGGEFRHIRSLPNVATSLPSPEIRGMTETADGTVWVSTPNRGFVSIDPADFSITRHDSLLSPDSAPVWFLEASAADGSVWVGLPGAPPGEAALFRFDASTGELHAYPDASPPDNPSAGSLYEAPDGTLWIGLPDGLARFDPSTRTLETNLLNRNVDVRHLFADSRGRIWVSTRDAGLAIYEVATGSTRWLQHPDVEDQLSQWVTAAYQSRQDPDVYWISTYGQGIVGYNERAGEFHGYSTRDGLADNVVYGILEDDDRFLWMSTNRGLSRFDPATETFQTFGMERGLQSWEFNQLAFHRSPATGQMYFGGINGLTVFDPSRLGSTESPPLTVLTRFFLHNRPVEPGGDSPLTTAAHLAGEVVLAADDNSVGFEFSATDYRLPEQNRYRYRLAGFDDAWVDAGSERRAMYTNLRSGSYTFEVQGANSNGLWSDEPARMSIVIRPPWWRTWWAYAGYVLLFVLGVVAADRVQRRRLLARERERTRQRELEQAREIEKAYVELREAKDRLVQQEKLASLGGLTAGIAHEIKNPLNFVNNFADLSGEICDEAVEALEGGRLDELKRVLADLRQNTEVIAEHGKRADGIVRSMMAHASGATSERTSVDVNELVSEYVDLAYHGKRAQDPRFEATVEKAFDPRAGAVDCVPSDVGRVILNLVGNAFDAAAEKAATQAGMVSAVRVETARNDGFVRVVVEDNGSGVPEANRDRVFEPFFTTKPAGTGTGLGLSLSFEIITQGHGGKLEVENVDGLGARFVVSLPA